MPVGPVAPVIPVAPVAKPAGAIVAEDLGARAPRPDVEERLKGVLERVREKLPPQEKKSFKPEILQASQELATRVMSAIFAFFFGFVYLIVNYYTYKVMTQGKMCKMNREKLFPFKT